MQTEKENYNFENQTISSDTINIREELSKYLIHWRLFVLFSIVSIVFAFLYLRYTAPIFRASATIMIKDNNQSGISTELAAFEDLGIIGGSSANNPENEIEILKSRKIIGNVVDNLILTTTYSYEGRIRATELYTRKLTIIINKILLLLYI